MTINEACIKVLTELGGKAPLKLICLKVQEIVVFKGATPYNSICTELINHPKNFRRSEGQKGWWELTSYQEEVAELKSQIVELTETNKQLIAIPKEAEFVDRFLKEVMNEYKRKRGEADPIRNILRHMGHEEAAAVLDAWIDEKEDELTKALLRLAEKPTYKYERGAIHLDKKQSIETENNDEIIRKIEDKKR
jgi:arginine deiminase